MHTEDGGSILKKKKRIAAVILFFIMLAGTGGDSDAAGKDAQEEEFQQINLSVIPVTVEKGDSLWKLSLEYYEDGKYWVKIYEWNYELIGDDPSLIYEGMELVLPWMRDWD